MPISVTLPTLGKPKTVKDAVVSVLSKEYPLSTRKLHNKVRNTGLSVSYQGVYKAVNELVEEGIIIKTCRNYQLNEEWVRKIKDFGDNLLSTIKNKNSSLEEIRGNQYTNLVFNTPMEMGNFFVDMLSADFGKIPRTIVGHWYHMNSPMFYSKKYLIRLKEITSKDRFFFIGYVNNFVTRWLARSWEKMNVKVKLGVECALECDVLVVDDFLIQVFWPLEIKKIFSASVNLKKIGSFDMAKVYQMLTQDAARINFVVVRNQDVAEQIRNETLKYFEK